MRLYIINLFGTGRRWVTTCPFLAVDFVNQMGPENVGLGSLVDPDMQYPIDVLLPL